ncbi:hypothetical protein E2C01_023078 [Portunus trituberculatus]|uniref:Uncharacterized protein n=1 Tax=Portunus trituberculatus TaxID=210409 RepID=A0A5B7E7V9_PORTR|nr:hypothetical protein [Portunus trituberculatus]
MDMYETNIQLIYNSTCEPIFLSSPFKEHTTLYLMDGTNRLLAQQSNVSSRHDCIIHPGVHGNIVASSEGHQACHCCLDLGWLTQESINTSANCCSSSPVACVHNGIHMRRPVFAPQHSQHTYLMEERMVSRFSARLLRVVSRSSAARTRICSSVRSWFSLSVRALAAISASTLFMSYLCRSSSSCSMVAVVEDISLAALAALSKAEESKR